MVDTIAKEILRIEDARYKVEVHRCLYPKPKLFVFYVDKITGLRKSKEIDVSKIDVPQ